MHCDFGWSESFFQHASLFPATRSLLLWYNIIRWYLFCFLYATRAIDSSLMCLVISPIFWIGPINYKFFCANDRKESGQEKKIQRTQRMHFLIQYSQRTRIHHLSVALYILFWSLGTYGRLVNTNNFYCCVRRWNWYLKRVYCNYSLLMNFILIIYNIFIFFKHYIYIYICIY